MLKSRMEGSVEEKDTLESEQVCRNLTADSSSLFFKLVVRLTKKSRFLPAATLR